MKTSNEIRAAFLRFFERHGHTIVPSSSLIPGNDPTLLFTNAGMVQFKDVFLGAEKRGYTRATTAQKCMRVAGKHNDLENVGPSPRHHTFFEMLGNFSFGDYFKADAIRLAWAFVTEELGLDPERLYATIYEDDDEAAKLWQEIAGLGPDRVGRLGAKSNFWEMGDTGPCGPNSEIFYDRGPEHCTCGLAACNPVTADVNDCERWWEFWNLVFMQYNRLADGSLEPLPRPSVDTGMGFERMVALLQNQESNYDTDLFTPMMDRTQTLLGHDDATRAANEVGYRVIADHSRAIAFLIADGVLPGNVGRNYVLRLILRRAARYGRMLGFRQVFLPQIIEVLIDNMGDHYRELQQRRDFIMAAVAQEEERFLQTLDTGLSLFDGIARELAARGETVIPGEQAFKLYDTYGFPLDLTKDVAKEQGLTIDEAGFQAALEEQRARARAAQQFEFDEEAELYRQLELPRTDFCGYEQTQADSEIIGLIIDGESRAEAQAGDTVQVVLGRTPFYGESGGQVGDQGTISTAQGQVHVSETRHPVPTLTVHYGQVTDGQIRVGDQATAIVDEERRLDIARNHTATHLLHKALQEVLGDHARQAGSLVAPERLRFDFTHLTSMTADEIAAVEARVNASIRADMALSTQQMGYQEALNEGTTALFGEKYGETVRQVKIGDYSSELCGGTHLGASGQIGYFIITNESSIGSGLRRIEALTGRGAEAHINSLRENLADLARLMDAKPAEVKAKIQTLLDEMRQQEKELESLRRDLAKQSAGELIDQAQQIAGAHVLATVVDVADMNGLREMTDLFRDRLGSAVVVLGAVLNEKPSIVASATHDLVERGVDAVKLVRAAAKIVGGGGGGRPNMAQAGGRDASKLEEALQIVPDTVATMLNEG